MHPFFSVHRFLFFFFVCLLSLLEPLNAQSIVVGDDNPVQGVSSGGSSTTGVGIPMAVWTNTLNGCRLATCSRTVFVYNKALMAASGFTPGTIIDKISFKAGGTTTVTPTGNLTIYFREVNSNPVTGSNVWTTLISGATQVYQAAVSVQQVQGQYVNAFDVNNFTYTDPANNHLLVAVEYSNNQTCNPNVSSVLNWVYSTYSNANGTWSRIGTDQNFPPSSACTANLTTGSSTINFPNTAFNVIGGNPPPCTAPSTQTFNLQAGSLTGTTASISWANGNGAGRVLYINTQNSFVAPSNGALPNANPVYSGVGQQCIFAGGGSGPVAVSGLTAGTTYYVRAYEYCAPDTIYATGSSNTNPISFTTTNPPPPPCTAPSTQTFNLQAGSLTGTTASISWANGNGAGRVLYINTQNSFVAPSNGALPNANPVYSGVGQQCIFAGGGSGPVAVSGLTAGTTYYVRAYEYCAPDTIYATGSGNTNPISFSTLSGGNSCLPPTLQVAQFQIPNPNSTSAQITWTSGNGSGRVVYIHQINSFVPPAAGALPSPNTVYSGAGQQCIFAGNSANTVTVTGLQPGTTYYVRGYEYCQPGFEFNTSTASDNPQPFTTPQAPYLILNPDSLSGFSYVLGAGPSAAQSYQLTGGNLLTGTVSVAASTAFELSSDGLNFSNSLSLSTQGGVVVGQPLTLFVRLKAGLPLGQHGWAAQMHSGGGAPSVTLYCMGEVVSATGIQTEPEFQGMRIWPNPSRKGQSLHLNFSALESGSYLVEWTDLQGRVLLREAQQFHGVVDQALSMPLDAAGVFLVTVYGESGNVLGRSRLVVVPD